MSKNKLLIVYLFLSYSLFAQKYNISVNYSGFPLNSNFNSISEFSVGGNYIFPQNYISVGISSSFFFAEHNHLVDSAGIVNGISFSLALNGKYYPFTYSLTNSKYIQPFFSVGIGNNLYNNFYMKGNLKACTQQFRFSISNHFYSYLSSGIILGGKLFQFLFEVKYQIRNPKITFKKPNCIDGIPNVTKPYKKINKMVNLNALVVGFGINIFL